LIASLEHEKILTMCDVLRIYRIGVTFAERKIIYRIQQVGFTLSVAAEKTVDARRKLQVGVPYIFEIQNG